MKYVVFYEVGGDDVAAKAQAHSPLTTPGTRSSTAGASYS
jgi:hypothetical protein